MKQTKRILLTSLLVLVMMLGIFAMSACNKNNIALNFYIGENMASQILVKGDETVTLPSAQTKAGYVFDGWYLDQGTWERPFTENSLVNSPIYEDTKVYAKYTPITYTITYHYAPENSHFPVDSNENPVTYDTEDNVKLTSLINNSDTLDFAGWYTSETGGKKVETLAGLTGNLDLYERWELHDYKVAYHNVNGASVVAAGNFKDNPKAYNIDSAKSADIPILSLSRLGYVFKGWFSDPELTIAAPTAITKDMTGNLAFYAKWEKDSSNYIRVDENNNPKIDGSYVLFGTYPQTLVSDTTVIDSLEELAGDLPIPEDNRSWTSYGYYKGNGSHGSSSNNENFMWYIDIELNGEDYRGVYFIDYRSAHTSHDSSDSYQDNNGYVTGRVYWFKYDYIKWKILQNLEDGKSLLICDMIIDAQAYQNLYTFKDGHYYTTDANGEIVKVSEAGVLANNYAYSSIREWLNDEFYNTAFTSLQKSIILSTAVDNSAATTDKESNANACENTNDFVFLPSYADMLNADYGFNTDPLYTDGEKKKKPTDYALAQGTSTGNDYQNKDCISWWLRSPDGSLDFSANVVGYDGYLGYDPYVYATYYGVCPAIWVQLDPVAAQ